MPFDVTSVFFVAYPWPIFTNFYLHKSTHEIRLGKNEQTKASTLKNQCKNSVFWAYPDFFELSGRIWCEMWCLRPVSRVCFMSVNGKKVRLLYRQNAAFSRYYFRIYAV